jgi:uncharacterized protein YukJ
MPLDRYGVLVARPIRGVDGRGKNAHYQIHAVDKLTEYRIAVNVQSQEKPSEVEYLVDDDFQHPITESLQARELGFYELDRTPSGGGLDFIRGNLLDRSRMRPLPRNVAGPNNDLNDQVDAMVQKALAEEDALIYAFGQRWGPEEDVRDKIFGFLPGNGIHDVHMNQGNVDRFVKDDGVWQDGGLMFFLPSVDKWTALFLKFQSQTWHTDDQTGHRIEPIGEPIETRPPIPRPPLPGEPDFRLRIVAALVNPVGPDQEWETVTVLNASNVTVNLGGWSIANKDKKRAPLTGEIRNGQAITFTMPVDVPLSNKGGLITLLDDKGLKVHGVSYTKAQASREGWTMTF